MSLSSNSDLTLSMVVPVYNEGVVVNTFYQKVTELFLAKGISYEIVFINDGSTDDTLSFLKALHESDPDRVCVLSFSRNYGKEIALTAGLDKCRGKCAVPLDCDLQDPPELIFEMLDLWNQGYQVVNAKRIDRSSDSFVKRSSASAFYNLISRVSEIDIPENVGDFRLLDRCAIESLKTYRERSRFMKGLFASLGYKVTQVEYVRPERVEGTTKWSYLKLYKLALEGIISFTSFPLKVWSYLGLGISGSAFFYGIYLIIKTTLYGVDTPGYASLMVVMLFMSGVVLTGLGVIGEYVARIYDETKQRPLYIIAEELSTSRD